MSAKPGDRPVAVFRADGGAWIGGGHIVRCGALADALRRDGWRCGFAARADTLSYFTALPDAFTKIVPLGGDGPDALTAHWPDGCDLLVVDHYGLGLQFERGCRPWARRILAFDDVADRPHDCDLLLDGTPGRADSTYGGLVPEGAGLLLGVDYLPLRREFAALRRRVLPRPTPQPPWRVLLCLGAGFVVDTVLDVIDALDASGLEHVLDVVIGALPRGDHLRTRVGAKGGRLHVATDAMAKLIADADIAIGAAGVGGWERCCLGLPSVSLILADNQKPNGAALARAGAAHVLPGSSRPVDIVAALTEILEDPDRWQRMSQAAAGLCDGLGPARTVARIDDRWHDKAGAPIRLRSARSEDALPMLDWQTHPTTRRYARNPEPPTREEHLAWFAAKRADPRCLFQVLTRGDTPAGVLRLDRMEDADAFEVSILVAPEHRRAGLSRAALALGRKLVSDADLWAYVKPENAASIALFRGAGYAETGRPDWYLNRAIENAVDG